MPHRYSFDSRTPIEWIRTKCSNAISQIQSANRRTVTESIVPNLCNGLRQRYNLKTGAAVKAILRNRLKSRIRHIHADERCAVFECARADFDNLIARRFILIEFDGLQGRAARKRALVHADRDAVDRARNAEQRWIADNFGNMNEVWLGVKRFNRRFELLQLRDGNLIAGHIIMIQLLIRASALQQELQRGGYDLRAIRCISQDHVIERICARETVHCALIADKTGDRIRVLLRIHAIVIPLGIQRHRPGDSIVFKIPCAAAVGRIGIPAHKAAEIFGRYGRLTQIAIDRHGLPVLPGDRRAGISQERAADRIKAHLDIILPLGKKRNRCRKILDRVGHHAHRIEQILMEGAFLVPYLQFAGLILHQPLIGLLRIGAQLRQRQRRLHHRFIQDFLFLLNVIDDRRFIRYRHDNFACAGFKMHIICAVTAIRAVFLKMLLSFVVVAPQRIRIAEHIPDEITALISDLMPGDFSPYADINLDANRKFTLKRRTWETIQKYIARFSNKTICNSRLGLEAGNDAGDSKSTYDAKEHFKLAAARAFHLIVYLVDVDTFPVSVIVYVDFDVAALHHLAPKERTRNLKGCRQIEYHASRAQREISAEQLTFLGFCFRIQIKQFVNLFT